MHIDSFCLRHAENVAHAIERYSGLHTFTLSALGFLAASVTAFHFMVTARETVPLFVLGSLVFIVIALLNLGMMPYFIRTHYILLSRGCMNPLKVDPRMVPSRVVATISVVMSLASFLILNSADLADMSLIFVGLWTCVYFRSCDPLPPGTSGMRRPSHAH